MNTEAFYKVYGATGRNDNLTQIGQKNWLLVYGFFKDDDTDNGGNYRKNYDHKPSLDELRIDIENLINKETDNAIINGFVWEGKPVYLSTENQINFKVAYDLAIQSDGSTLPVKFKLGENKCGTPVYHLFQDLTSFTDFYTKVFTYISQCLNKGWKEKDNVDYQKLLNNE